MIPQMSYRLTKALRGEELARAEAGRLRRAGATGWAGAHGTGVINALGHGLIAMGSRLVSDPRAHPTHRRAA